MKKHGGAYNCEMPTYLVMKYDDDQYYILNKKTGNTGCKNSGNSSTYEVSTKSYAVNDIINNLQQGKVQYESNGENVIVHTSFYCTVDNEKQVFYNSKPVNIGVIEKNQFKPFSCADIITYENKRMQDFEIQLENWKAAIENKQTSNLSEEPTPESPTTHNNNNNNETAIQKIETKQDIEPVKMSDQLERNKEEVKRKAEELKRKAKAAEELKRKAKAAEEVKRKAKAAEETNIKLSKAEIKCKKYFDSNLINNTDIYCGTDNANKNKNYDNDLIKEVTSIFTNKIDTQQQVKTLFNVNNIESLTTIIHEITNDGSTYDIQEHLKNIDCDSNEEDNNNAYKNLIKFVQIMIKKNKCSIECSSKILSKRGGSRRKQKRKTKRRATRRRRRKL
jgi:hypothetical protein